MVFHCTNMDWCCWLCLWVKNEEVHWVPEGKKHLVTLLSQRTCYQWLKKCCLVLLSSSDILNCGFKRFKAAHQIFAFNCSYTLGTRNSGWHHTKCNPTGLPCKKILIELLHRQVEGQITCSVPELQFSFIGDEPPVTGLWTRYYSH